MAIEIQCPHCNNKVKLSMSGSEVVAEAIESKVAPIEDENEILADLIKSGGKSDNGE